MTANNEPEKKMKVFTIAITDNGFTLASETGTIASYEVSPGGHKGTRKNTLDLAALSEAVDSDFDEDNDNDDLEELLDKGTDFAEALHRAIIGR